VTSADEKVAVLESEVNGILGAIARLDARSIEAGNQVAAMVGSVSHLAVSVTELTEELKSWGRVSSDRLRAVEGEIYAMKAVEEERNRHHNATFNRVMAICAVCSAVPTTVVFFSLRGGR